MTAAASVNDLLTELYTAATVVVKSMTDPAVIEEATLKNRADALSAIGRFVAMLHKFQGQPLPAQATGAKANQPQPAAEKAAAASTAAASVRLPAPLNVEAVPALNRHERRQRDALLRRSGNS